MCVHLHKRKGAIKPMNSTIKQVSRPQKKSGTKGLPPEAKKFAKQMGLDLTGLEAEVCHPTECTT